MKTCVRLFFIFCLGLLTSTSFAQTASIDGDVKMISDLAATSEECIFYSLEEGEQTVFVDFENIQINLNEIVLKNTEGKELMREDVSHLPVNAIFEIDLKEYEANGFVVELKSYAKTIKKAIEL